MFIRPHLINSFAVRLERSQSTDLEMWRGIMSGEPLSGLMSVTKRDRMGLTAYQFPGKVHIDHYVLVALSLHYPIT